MLRASQIAAEVLFVADRGSPLRASQIATQVLFGYNNAPLRASQASAEVLFGYDNVPVRASQSYLGVLYGYNAIPLRVSQALLEILVWNYEVVMPAVYPTLPGLTYSVIKRPRFYTGIGTSVSGREVRVAYAANPLWEWDLTYDYLPDMQTATSATNSDLKQIMGFYLSQSGAFGGFLFLDPDDNAVSAQAIGTTDGTTVLWTLVRTYGGTDGTGTEPIGYVNGSAAFHLYLDGVMVDPATYDLLSTTPVNQQIRFHAAPATGKAITVTMGYYYFVRFKEDHTEYDKFMDRLWSMATVTLTSLRG